MAKIILVVLVAVAAAAAFIVLPCYVLPELGGDDRLWCGTRSLPRYWAVQACVGFVAGGLAAASLLFLRGRRNRSRGDVIDG